jgi:hypothetical protein
MNPFIYFQGGLVVEHPLIKEHVDQIDANEGSGLGLSKNLV